LQSPPQALYKFELAPYLELVDRACGAIGWRLHGNMLHLAHGNPTVFFANCSRVLSFSEAFALPCIYAEDGEKIAPKVLADSVEHLLAADIYSAFPSRYAEYYLEMSKFLDCNGITHNLKKVQGA
jgi:hypothetical protein